MPDPGLTDFNLIDELLALIGWNNENLGDHLSLKRSRKIPMQAEVVAVRRDFIDQIIRYIPPVVLTTEIRTSR